MLVDSGSDIGPALLAWYDIHARRLPWRAPPGTPPTEPYRVWLSEVMLQQTTVTAVKAYFEAFTTRWPTVRDLADAADEAVMTAWAGLGYYARARNLLACARAVRDGGGAFPDTEEGLRALPGIGAYTAAAIAAIAFNRRAVVVDGNVERVVARLFVVDTPLPAARGAIRALTDRITPSTRSGDFAQAMMDLGATICTPRNPVCALCPLAEWCRARAGGVQQDFPRKAPRQAKPVRRGTLFWLQSGDAVLLTRRPAKGLLGGMRALPSGPWQADAPGLLDAPIAGDWQHVGSGRHVFTHFALDYDVVTMTTDERTIDGEWWPVERLAEAGLPTLFAKAAERVIATV